MKAELYRYIFSEKIANIDKFHFLFAYVWIFNMNSENLNIYLSPDFSVNEFQKSNFMGFCSCARSDIRFF